MRGVEIATALFCLVMSVSLIAIACWVSTISSSLARLRDANALAREAQEQQGRSISSWIVSVSQRVQELGRKQDEMLSKLQDLLYPTGERPAIAGQPKEPPPAPAPTVMPALQLAPTPEDRLEDAAKRSWTGPPSSRTMLGDRVVHEPDRTPASSPLTAQMKR